MDNCDENESCDSGDESNMNMSCFWYMMMMIMMIMMIITFKMVTRNKNRGNSESSNGPEHQSKRKSVKSVPHSRPLTHLECLRLRTVTVRKTTPVMSVPHADCDKFLCHLEEEKMCSRDGKVAKELLKQMDSTNKNNVKIIMEKTKESFLRKCETLSVSDGKIASKGTQYKAHPSKSARPFDSNMDDQLNKAYEDSQKTDEEKRIITTDKSEKWKTCTKDLLKNRFNPVYRQEVVVPVYGENGQRYRSTTQNYPEFSSVIYGSDVHRFLQANKQSRLSPHCGIILDKNLLCGRWTGATYREKHEYDLCCKLGQGGFGDVFRCKLSCPCCPNRRPFAVKRFKKTFMEQEVIPMVSFFESSHVLQLLGIVQDGKHISVFMEEALGGRLLPDSSWVKSWNLEKLAGFTLRCLEGLKLFHCHEWFLRDIKPSNIVFKREHDVGSAVFIDFGSSHNPFYKLLHDGLTFVYFPPEWKETLSATSHSNDVSQLLGAWDVFQFGSVLFELIVGFSLWSEDYIGMKKRYGRSSSAKLLKTHISGNGEAILDKLELLIFQLKQRWPDDETIPMLIDLIAQMLQPNSSRRITANEAVLHPYCHEYVLVRLLKPNDGQLILCLPVPLRTRIKEILQKIRDELPDGFKNFMTLSHLGRNVHPSEIIVNDCMIIPEYEK